MKKINFCVKDFVFNEDGLIDFYYPVSMKTLEKFRLKVYKKLLFLINSSKNEFFDILKINISVITKELTIFFSIKKNIVLMEKKLRLNCSNNKYIESIYLKKSIPFSNSANQLVFRHLKEKNFLLSFLSKQRSLFFHKNFKYIKKENIDKSHIITFSRNDLIEKKLYQSKSKLRLSHFHDWFQVGKIKKFNELNKDNTIASLKTYNEIEKIFKIFGINLLNNEKQYVLKLFNNSFKLNSTYYKNLLNNKKYLPQKVWLGSTGNLFSRIFSLAVKNNNGIVYGFDHGSGSGIKDSKTQHVVEFNYINKFFTFNKQMQIGLKKKFDKSLLFNKKFTKKNICYVNNKNTRIRKFKKENNYKNIVYISRVFTKESIVQGFNIYYPDQIYLDWQARLFNYLKKLDFNLYYKPHPHNFNDIPRSLYKSFKLKIIKEDMLYAYKKADILLFDSFETSAFNESVKTDIPILLININERELDRKYVKILKKRCSYLKTGLDSKNKLKLNFQELNKGLKKLKKISLPNKEILHFVN